MGDHSFLSPSEMADACDVTVDTLRYYEREGLLTSVRRTRGNQRRYSPDDVAWVKILRCLRVTAMPIRDLQQFAELVRQGDTGTSARLELLRAHRSHVLEQRRQLDEALAVIEGKIAAYEDIVDTHPHAESDPTASMPTLGGQGARR